MTRQPKQIEAALQGCWIVILIDPDDSNWSPWPVIANGKQQAILKAQSDWRKWSRVNAVAEVVKAYAKSWIGEIA